MILICEGCGDEFERATGRFCSARCGLRSAGSSNEGKQQGQNSSEADRQQKAIHGSDALLNRIMDYYVSYAKKHGLGGPWEAAVCLGMAA